MALICKACGYRQSEEETVTAFKRRFPKTEEHDIPYYCGACQDNATDGEYGRMMAEMDGSIGESKKSDKE